MPEERSSPSGGDAEILGRLRRGDEEAFEELVAAHRRDLYRLAYRLTGSPDEADDVTQETFLRAYRSLRSFRGEATLRTWLMRIAVNLSLNLMQSAGVARRHPGPVEGTAPPVEPAGERNLVERERQERLGPAIRALPPRQRMTLILRVSEGLKFREIARMMGCSTGAAKANFFHAVAALRRGMKDLA